MLNDSSFEHIYLAAGYTDLRRGIDGLVALITNEFHLDPYDPQSIFLFCGRRTDRIKAIIYEGDGHVLLYKRLVDGCFQWPRSPEQAEKITLQQFRWLMDGLSVKQKKVIHRKQPTLI